MERFMIDFKRRFISMTVPFYILPILVVTEGQIITIKLQFLKKTYVNFLCFQAVLVFRLILVAVVSIKSKLATVAWNHAKAHLAEI